MSSSEQARFDREFLIIAVCDTWLTVAAHIHKLHRAVKPYLDAVNNLGDE